MSDAHTQPPEGLTVGTQPRWGEASTKRNPAIHVIQDEFDEYGAEFGERARVWKAYVREADMSDMEQVDEWHNEKQINNRSLDVILLFGVLFTIVCTPFAVQSSSLLTPNLSDVSVAQLGVITEILRGIADGSRPSELNSTQTANVGMFQPSLVHVWINALWFSSLLLGAAVSIIAILAKEWCILLMSGRVGDSWSQMIRRQQRWEGVEKWKMGQVIIFLPALIHLAVYKEVSFVTGICLYLWTLHLAVAIPALIITAFPILVYGVSTLLPFFNPSDVVCPYSTSISRFIQRLGGPDPECYYKSPNRIAIEALAWLIKTSQDPKSIDTALQAIAGANPNDEHRQLLKESGADTMILRRLIGLDSYSTNYDKLLDLYTRARLFFQPPTTASVSQQGAPTLAGEKVSLSAGEGFQGNINREVQRKMRDLRDMMDRQITTYTATSDHVFRSIPDNVQALRIGSTAASHCLRSMEHETQAHMHEQFDSAIDLLENYKNRQAHLEIRESQYLITGTAILLSSLLDCPPATGAQYVMRLLRIVCRAGDGQNPLPMEQLGLPMAVYALSRHDYPGWTRRPPLSSICRTERSIEMIAYYVSHHSEFANITTSMAKLGLLELLSNPEEYKLDDDDIMILGKASHLLADVAGPARIHTLSENAHIDIYPRAFEVVTKMIQGEHYQLSRDAIATTCLTILNLAQRAYLPPGIPLGEIYVFVIECALDPPRLSLGPEAYEKDIALDVMQKFHDYSWTQDSILDLARALGKKQMFTKFKEALEVESSDNIIMKLFATGQAWFLIDHAIKSETADHEDWTRCLSPFIGDESVPDLVMRRLREQRNILADQYRGVWKNDALHRQIRHSYFQILYNSLPTARIGEGAHN
ncbi:unnamed protein product [Rhizoctonia solani]|uniref:DUF6535 domain-containing protein n=1 Tax=Rhizoctonia solani TaxID=456999 RepID=A0A8H3GKC7_9AGAM|nr:unnamed protein product [Rhizoctonia solani]